MDDKKIMQVTPCRFVTNQCIASPSGYSSHLRYGEKTKTRIARAALEHLEKMREADINTHQGNLPALENNKLVRAEIEALMTRIGMPKEYRERDPRSRAAIPKSIRHDAGYIADMQRHVPVDDLFGYATDTYNRLKASFERYADEAGHEAKIEEQRRQAEAEAIKGQRRAMVELAQVVVHHGLDPESGWDDVLKHLRGQTQRLDLALAMEDVRNDWTDGPDPVMAALGRFRIETDEDKAIVNDVMRHIVDWDGDGRVFRDTEWNYGRLFASIEDQQLVTDARLAAAKTRD